VTACQIGKRFLPAIEIVTVPPYVLTMS